ncbi:GntR family transcriptional regulator [Sphaerimonospora mesophila]|uniref:GntR family transcriptional regulator n=1 Tax=Sphaerimonospora mesophila TaxID=37483 RepID=UPI0007C77AD6
MSHPIGSAFYLKLADDLRSQISAGSIEVGSAIPSTADLAQSYGVSRTVVREAVKLLRNEGLLQGQPGKAVYVIAKPQEVEEKRITLEDLAQQVAGLREDVRALNERVGAGREDRDLTAEVIELRSLVEQLYQRLGHNTPNNRQTAPKPRRRGTGT